MEIQSKRAQPAKTWGEIMNWRPRAEDSAIPKVIAAAVAAILAFSTSENGVLLAADPTRPTSGDAVLTPSFFDPALAPSAGNPSSKEGKLAAIQQLLRGGQGDQAIAQARELVKDHPDFLAGTQILVSALMARGAFREGEAEMQRLVAEKPDDPALLCQLGGVQLLGRSLSGAKDSFAKALKIKADYVPALFGLGIVADEERQTEEARGFYEQGLKISTNSPPLAIKINLSRLYNQRGEFAKTVSLLQGALTDDPSAASGRMTLGMAYFGLGRRSDAERELAAAERAAGGNDRLWLWLSAAYRGLGQNEKSMEVLSKVSAAFTGEATFQRAETLGAMRRWKEAEAAFLQSAEAGVEPWIAKKKVGDLFFAQGNKEQAKTIYQEVLDLPGVPAPAFDAVGGAYEKGELFPEALATHVKASEKFPGEPLPLYRQGLLYLAMGKPGEAIVPLQRMLTIRPGDPAGLRLLSLANQRIGSNAQAIQLAEQLVASQPASIDAGLFLAVTLQQSGRGAEAIQAYEKVLGLDPRHVIALNNCAVLLNEAGRRPEALRYARDAVAASSKPNGALLDTLGWILVEQDSLPEGVKTLEQSILLSPKDPSIRYHLGVAYERSKQSGKALQQFEQALSLSSAFPEHDLARQARDRLKAGGSQGKTR